VRYFEIYNATAYESVRLQLDANRGLPAGETTYAPEAKAQRTANGNLLLAIRDQHAAQSDIASAIGLMNANNWGWEITKPEYESLLVRPKPLA